MESRRLQTEEGLLMKPYNNAPPHWSHLLKRSCDCAHVANSGIPLPRFSLHLLPAGRRSGWGSGFVVHNKHGSVRRKRECVWGGGLSRVV